MPRSTVSFITLASDIPAVTEVIARKRIIAIMAIEKLTVFTLAASWRMVTMLSPRQYRRAPLEHLE